MRRRNGIEPVLGHMKADGLLERNHLGGTEGDAVNVSNGIETGPPIGVEKDLPFGASLRAALSGPEP